MDVSEKLRDLPPILYINLDRQPIRRATFEEGCKKYGIKDYTRIEAYDGKGENLVGYLTGDYPKGVSTSEVGCAMSHLRALKYFVEETDHDRILICEDDLDFSTVSQWQFTWSDFETHLPYDWEIVQLVIDNPTSVYLYLHVRFINDFSAACYLITREYAKRLLAFHCVGDKYKLDQTIKPLPVADILLFSPARAYSLPLFTIVVSTEGAINERTYAGQVRSNNIAKEFWERHASDPHPNIAFLWDYNPFIGQLPPEAYREKPNS
jgi:GR25 family glycosyltransferase involved in LPS biosynthesis